MFGLNNFRFHRILKREKLKKMMKEFEELQKTDAQAALEKFNEADKLRILVSVFDFPIRHFCIMYLP